MAAEYTLVSADNGFHGWQVGASASLGTTWTAQIQLLFAGKTTPQAMMAALQSTYKADLANR